MRKRARQTEEDLCAHAASVRETVCVRQKGGDVRSNGTLT